MYRHILLPTDGSELSEKAIRHGVKLARALKARVTGMTNTPTWHDLYAGPGARMMSVDDNEREAKAAAQAALSKIARNAKHCPKILVHYFPKMHRGQLSISYILFCERSYEWHLSTNKKNRRDYSGIQRGKNNQRRVACVEKFCCVFRNYRC